MAKGKLYRRKRDIRDILPTAVIICEGSETEINYFKNFKKRRGLKLVVCNHGRTDVVNIVKSALKTINRYDLELNKNDTLWAVFDCDENLQTQLDKAVTLAANKVELIFSNPCFEFWYLLHYEDWTNIIVRNDVIKRLKIYIEEYNKSKNYVKVIKSLLPNAIQRAKQIADNYKDRNVNLLQRYLNKNDNRASTLLRSTFKILQSGFNLVEQSTNPLTLVYVLVSFILENTKER